MAISVREKNKGSGEYWLFGRHNGNRFSRKIGDEKIAKEIAKKLEAKIVLGEFDLPSTKEKIPTFGEYAPLWIDGFIKLTRKPSTHERYQGILNNHVYPSLGKCQIDKIKRKDVRELLLSVHSKGLSRSTICLVRDVMSGVLGHALDDELVSANPVIGITKKMKLGDAKEDVLPLTASEVVDFLTACLEFEPAYYPLFLMAFRTGMRMGEILTLLWDDVNMEGQFIEVRKSIFRNIVSTTKKGRERRVDMSGQLLSCLYDLYDQCKVDARVAGEDGEVCGLIFHKNGKNIHKNTLRNVFNQW